MSQEKVKVRNIGIPWIKPPSKVCNDKNCPWHGNIRVRGKILEVTVVSTKMQKTAVVLHEWLHYDKKYKRYERRRRKLHVHVPPCIEIKPGDRVIIGETRPIAKTVSFVVLGKKEDVIPVKPKVWKLEEEEGKKEESKQ